MVVLNRHFLIHMDHPPTIVKLLPDHQNAHRERMWNALQAVLLDVKDFARVSYNAVQRDESLSSDIVRQSMVARYKLGSEVFMFYAALTYLMVFVAILFLIHVKNLNTKVHHVQ
jgi:hypothetical protein